MTPLSEGIRAKYLMAFLESKQTLMTNTTLHLSLLLNGFLTLALRSKVAVVTFKAKKKY